jgi:uncharacterized repeat protein (TIGR02543 family)
MMPEDRPWAASFKSLPRGICMKKFVAFFAGGKHSIPGGIFLLSLFFLGCSIPNTEPAAPGGNAEEALVYITINANGSRSVLPQITLDGISFELFGAKGGGDETSLLKNIGQGGASIAIEEGVWNFTLKGSRDGSLVLTGSITNKTISASGPNTLDFEVAPIYAVYGEGSGHVKVTIALPEGAGVTSAEVVLVKTENTVKPAFNAGLTVTDSMVTLEGDWPVGDFFVSIKLKDSAGKLKGVVSELIRVRANLSSEKEITLSADDLKDVKYMVTFDTNGGSTENPVTVADGDKVAKPADPTKAGYEFDRWYADAELTTLFDFDTPITGDTTLYAGWKPLMAITITLKPATDPTLAAKEITWGESAVFDAGAGYSSYRWYLDGEEIPSAGGQTYTLNTASMDKPAYELSVLVGTSTGEMLSARCRVMVKYGSDISGTETAHYGGLPINALVPEKTGRRPIPLSAISGIGYNDMRFYPGNGPVFEADNAWRKAAWARIEQNRKGAITVIVKDTSGDVISGAAVNLAMYEHEYQWGTAVNETVYAAGSTGQKYGAAVSALFNAAVLENGHKWVTWENNKTDAKSQYDKAVALGIRYVRGHALMWDRSYPSGWENNSAVPQELYNYLQADNRTALDNLIKTHILSITGAYNGKVVDWDVVNELLENHAIQDKYGKEVLKQWYGWAREGAGSGTKLFINETNIWGIASTITPSYLTANTAKFKTVLDWMKNNDVDFDGIGIQSHFYNSQVSPQDFHDKVMPEDFYNMLNGFGTYGKTLKVTEFDMGEEIASADRGYEAGFTRDIMIAAFSQPDTDGFLMWGFFSGSHWLDNAPVFNADWSLKESGIQYIDLVYNKWRTRTRGTTGADGSCVLRGFYGDYDITVSANGKTKTVEDARFYKGQNNTITVVLN